MPSRPDRIQIADDLEISRITTGLWQMADQERNNTVLNLDEMALQLAQYAKDGFDTFDMADHYGNAEIVAGLACSILLENELQAPIILTKWCPEPGLMTMSHVREGVERALDRLNVATIDLMQFHWWRYEDPNYLDALAGLMRLKEEGLIRHIGLTNFDGAHLRLVLKNGIEVATNQVSFSLLDRRAEGRLTEVCQTFDVKLLAYGTLCGGFMSERWLGAPEPSDIGDWSKMKYKRFIDAAGGWDAYQRLLMVLKAVADKHEASVANVASRWVLDHESVASVIVGARLGERSHRADNLELFGLRLDEADRSDIAGALVPMMPIEGDCGDEYRRPPFLTASGDLSHHLEQLATVYPVKSVPVRPDRTRIDTMSEWEEVTGFSRAVRVGNRILVSGTTATDAKGQCVCPGDAEGQTLFILDKISAALQGLNSGLEDIVRTRIYMRNSKNWEAAAIAHKRLLGRTLPANTLIEVAGLVGAYEVEIEAEAVIGD